jgi:hypothetical protein
MNHDKVDTNRSKPAGLWRGISLAIFFTGASIGPGPSRLSAAQKVPSAPRPKLSLNDFLSTSERARLMSLAQKRTRTSGEEIEVAALMATARKRATILVTLAQKENRRRPALEKLQENLQRQLQTRVFLDEKDGRQFEALLRKRQRSEAEQAALQKLMLVGSQHYHLVFNAARKENRTDEENQTLQQYGELAKRNSTLVKAYGVELLGRLINLQNQLAALFLLDDAQTKRALQLSRKSSRTPEENAQLDSLRQDSAVRFSEFLTLSQKPTPTEAEKSKLVQLREQVIRKAPAIAQLMDAEYEEIEQLNAQLGSDSSLKALPPLRSMTKSQPIRSIPKTTARAASVSAAPHRQKPRQGTIINLSPHIKIVGFSFVPSGASSYTCSYRWLHAGVNKVVAFEIVTLPYNTFNEQRRVVATMVRPRGEAPFNPGAVGAQNVSLSGENDIYTAVSYIRRVRLSDGTVWQVDESTLRSRIKNAVPGLKQIGRLSPP